MLPTAAGRNLTWILAVVLWAASSPAARTAQKADAQVLVPQLRKAMEAEAPDWALDKGVELGPGSSGSFFLAWRRGEDRLDVTCDQYDSNEEAVRQLRQLTDRISAGRPRPLPGVADEAHYLGPYGVHGSWRTYFARRWFVCQAGGGPKATTLRLTDTVVKVLDGAIRRPSL